MVTPVRDAAIRDRLQAALGTSLRARDKAAASALRSALAAIDNAGAVPAGPQRGTRIAWEASGDSFHR